MNLIKTDVEGLMKDLKSGAVLNTDTAKLEAYRKQKQQIESASNNSKRIDKIENDINQIKEMLIQLIKVSK